MTTSFPLLQSLRLLCLLTNINIECIELIILWRIDPLLRDASINSGRCYVTPARYTHLTIEQRAMQPVSKQRLGKHVSAVNKPQQ
jgi:hypothetical protein